MSGYNAYDRYQIIISGYTNYNNLRDKELKGLRPFYRNKNFQRSDRKALKFQKKTDWFKNSNKNRVHNFKSVFFVPSTPGSELLKMLRETEYERQRI